VAWPGYGTAVARLFVGLAGGFGAAGPHITSALVLMTWT
jgi:hypothetical protein